MHDFEGDIGNLAPSHIYFFALLPVHHKEHNINPIFSLKAMEPTHNKTSEPKSPKKRFILIS